uniref:Uncharacterized protein n=1 Tax=Myoviridae sp. ctijX18 TaxID=2825154 RepID=A0A8S5USI5_9CAUD|nr:MAG TPA: hypothetical protein [Myoviridae sp. ctijX18]DAJ69051.1 MAG TPA: hypothetical protein [Caudoviricetes sp.]
MQEWQNRSQQVGDQILFDNQMLAEFAAVRKQLTDALSRVDKLEEMLKSTTLQLIAYRTVIETLQEVQQVQNQAAEAAPVLEPHVHPNEETTVTGYSNYPYPTHVPTVTVIEEEAELPVRVELAVEENKKAYNIEEEVQQSKPTPSTKEDKK